MLKDGCCRSKERIRIYFKIGRSTKRFVFLELIYFVLTYVLYTCMFPAGSFCQRTCVAQGLLIWVPTETWNQSCFQYEWPLVCLIGLFRGRCSSFLEYVYFGLLYPSLVFDIFIVVCVGVGVVLRFFVCLSVYHGECCGFKFNGSTFYFFVCVCMFWVFSFVWEHVWHKV